MLGYFTSLNFFRIYRLTSFRHSQGLAVAMALLQTASLKIPATAGPRVAPHGSNLRSVFVGEGRGRLSLGRQLIVHKGQRRLYCVKASGTNDQ